MYVVVVQKFTFAISSPDEFLYSSEVIVLTNKQTPLKTSTSLRYTTPVENQLDDLSRACGVCETAETVPT